MDMPTMVLIALCAFISGVCLGAVLMSVTGDIE